MRGKDLHICWPRNIGICDFERYKFVYQKQNYFYVNTLGYVTIAPSTAFMEIDVRDKNKDALKFSFNYSTNVGNQLAIAGWGSSDISSRYMTLFMGCFTEFEIPNFTLLQNLEICAMLMARCKGFSNYNFLRNHWESKHRILDSIPSGCSETFS